MSKAWDARRFFPQLLTKSFVNTDSYGWTPNRLKSIRYIERLPLPQDARHVRTTPLEGAGDVQKRDRNSRGEQERTARSIVMVIVAVCVGLLAWTIAFAQKPALPQAQVVERGKYLVDEVAKCTECHTPRDKNNQLDSDQ